MAKFVSVLVVFGALLFGWAHHARNAESAASAQDAPDPQVRPRRLAPDETTGESTRGGRDEAIGGIRVGAVPDALAAHLGPKIRAGLLVDDVDPASAAASAGLAAFDVIVEVDGATASRDTLRKAIEQGDQVELKVVREGVEQLVFIPSRASAARAKGAFLSSAALGADHPFRKLAAVMTLRRSYETSASTARSEVRSLERRARALQREARREQVTLQKQCEKDVNEFLEAWAAKLIERVGERLDAASPSQLRALAIDVDALITQDAWQAIKVSVDRAGAALTRIERTDTPGVGRLPKTLAKHRRHRARHITEQMAGRFHNRVARPWKSSAKTLAKYRRHLGGFTSRVARAEQTHRVIRKEVAERIRCAVKRIRKRFADRLHRRIRKHEMPKPGEIDAALRAVCEQVEQMADRFVGRTENAVRTARTELESANGRLGSAGAAEMLRTRAAFDALAKRLEGALPAQDAESTGAVSSKAGSSAAAAAKGADATTERPAWRVRAIVDNDLDALRARILGVVNEGRDATRPPQVALVSAFREHRVVYCDLWEDLEALLGRIRSEAAGDCWSLNGPHLDGRFPRKVPRRPANPLIVRAGR